jgi:hypothetical protein
MLRHFCDKIKLKLIVFLLIVCLIQLNQFLNEDLRTNLSDFYSKLGREEETGRINQAIDASLDFYRDELYLNKLKESIHDSLSNLAYKNKYKTVIQAESAINNLNKNDILIVEYTKVFRRPRFCSFSNDQIFNSKLEKCKYQNCKYTCDKSKKTVKLADALIFHQRDLESEIDQNFNSNLDKWLQNTTQFPFNNTQDKLKNKPDQVWILWNDEATRISKNFDKLSSFFNWTMSYRTNSEIYHGTYGFLLREDNAQSEEKSQKVKEAFKTHFKKRKNAILWFVNNCYAKKRFKQALEISKHYAVYIYTKCKPEEESDIKQYSHLKLFRDACERGSECEKLNFNHFKYYLTFENTNCSDYITEKMWKSLANHMIPIVMQPNHDSFTRHEIPSKSFIHMKDFAFNAERLAQHLHRIDSDFSLYFDYIKWTLLYFKVYYEPELIDPHRMCKMCEALNKQFNNNEKRLSYDSIASFFNGNCFA